MERFFKIGLQLSPPASLVLEGALWLTLASLMGAGCSDSPRRTFAEGCKLTSDCRDTLVCTLERCHATCNTSVDCDDGARCILTTAGNVCQLEADKGCSQGATCEAPLVCAADLRCRNECLAADDCVTGQLCVDDGVCAEPDEVDEEGNLVDAPDDSKPGEGGAASQAGASGGLAPAAGTGGTSGEGGAGEGGAAGTTGLGGGPTGTPSLVVESGDEQTDLVHKTLNTVIATLVDATGQPMPNATVTIVAPDGGLVAPSETTTNAQGRIAVVPSLPLAVGAYEYAVLLDGEKVGAFSATATAPVPGTVITLITAGNNPWGFGNITSVAPGPDDTVLFAVAGVECGLYRLELSGAVSPVLGPGPCVPGGDGGPAAGATMGVAYQMRYHASRNSLFLFNRDAATVRELAFESGFIERIAGGGSAVGPSYGDGGFASNARFGAISGIGIGPDGALYVQDIEPDVHLLRKVDLETGIIDRVLEAPSNSSTCDGIRFSDSTLIGVFTRDGTLYVPGYGCTQGAFFDTLYSWQPPSAPVRFAGAYLGNGANGTPAGAFDMTCAEHFISGPNGDIFFGSRCNGRLYRIGYDDGLVHYLVGDGVRAQGADYVPALQASVNYAQAMAPVAGHIFYVDGGPGRLRVVW